MDSLIFSLNATIPVFLVIVLGYILMRVGFFTEGFVKIADKYVFKVALPVLLHRQQRGEAQRYSALLLSKIYTAAPVWGRL